MYLKYFSVAVLGLSFLSGCGKGAKADKQAVVVTNVPALPNITDNVFALSGGKTSNSYKSTMLILNPYGNPTELAELIRASEVTRVKAADARAFVDFYNGLYGEKGTLKDDIKTKEDDLKAFLAVAQARAQSAPLEDRKKNVASWFAETKTALALSAEDNAKLETAFGNYCDAKIFELAAHPTFARLAPNGYTERPSPNQLCENFYAEKGYFQGESCTTGNYFKCLWIEGVAKSGNLPAQNGETVASILEPIFADQAKAEIFRVLLLGDLTLTAQYLKPTTLAPIVEAIYTKKLYFYKALINGVPSTGNETACINNRLKPEVAVDFAFICGKLTRLWKVASPQTTTLALEFNSALDVINPGAKIISEVIKFFSQRRDSGPPQTSNSDFYFHSLTPGNSLTQPTPASLGLSDESMSRINELVLEKVFFSLTPEDRASKIEKEAAISTAKADLQARKDKLASLSKISSDALVDGIRAANAGSFSFGFLAYRMAVTHENEIMRATIVFDGPKNQIFEGCYDKIALKPIDCPAKDGPATTEVFRKATLNLNQAKGRIEFNMPIDDPALIGLGYNAKKPDSPDYFMDLAPETIQGTTLNLELYPNRLQKSLDILTGKGLFYRDGVPIYEVGVSMWED